MGGGGRKTQKSKLLLPWKVGGETPAPSWAPPQLPCFLLCPAPSSALAPAELSAGVNPQMPGRHPAQAGLALQPASWDGPPGTLVTSLPPPSRVPPSAPFQLCSPDSSHPILRLPSPRKYPGNWQRFRATRSRPAGFDNCPQSVNYFSWASRVFLSVIKHKINT